MKKNQILVAALDAEGVEVVGDALDLDDRSFRCFVLGVLWQNGLLASVDPTELPGHDMPPRLKPEAKGVMTLEEANRRNEEEAKAAEATQSPSPSNGVSYDDLTAPETPSSPESSAA